MPATHRNPRSQVGSSNRPPTRQGRLSTESRASPAAAASHHTGIRRVAPQLSMPPPPQAAPQPGYAQHPAFSGHAASAPQNQIEIALPEGYKGPIPPPIELIRDQLLQHMPEDHLQQLIEQETRANGGKPLTLESIGMQAPGQPAEPPPPQQQAVAGPQTYSNQPYDSASLAFNSSRMQSSAGPPGVDASHSMFQPKHNGQEQQMQGPQNGLAGMKGIGQPGRSRGTSIAGMNVWGASPGNTNASQQGPAPPPNPANSYANFVPQVPSTNVDQQSGSAGMHLKGSFDGSSNSQSSRYHAGQII